jgi:NAD(P)-dependent dehydrogenase (short-subunit alcohol dehydrogenase family)
MNVVVLGAASPLGVSVVRNLIADNYSVVGYDDERSRSTMADANYRHVAARCSDWPEQLARKRVPYGLLVLPEVEAGRPFLSIDYQGWRRQFERNVRLPLLAMRAVLPAMRARKRGAIVLLSSICARNGQGGNAATAASLGGVLGLARSAAVEVARDNVRINVVSPEYGALAAAQEAPESAEDLDDVYQAISLLLDEGNGYMTGQDVRVNAATMMF